MKKEAEAHAVEDKQKQELIEVKNLADSLVYTTEKTLKETGDKVSPDAKKEIEEKLESLKKVKDSDKIDEIKEKTAELSGSIQKIGAELYKQAPKEKDKPEEGEYKEKTQWIFDSFRPSMNF